MCNKISIRELREGDIKEVVRLHEMTSPWYNIDEEAIKTYIEMVQYKTIGLYEGATLCGIIIIMVIGEEADIIFIEVARSYRRRGYGTGMIKWIISEYSLGEIFLEVNERNNAAIQFYKAIGFYAIDNRRGYYKGGDGILMKYVSRETPYRPTLL